MLDTPPDPPRDARRTLRPQARDRARRRGDRLPRARRPRTSASSRSRCCTPSSRTRSAPQRFLREIKLTASLQHPHILPHPRLGRGGRRSSTTSCRTWRASRCAQRLDARQPAARSRRRCASGARSPARSPTRTSSGVVHRDIKPENILFSGGHAVLADFGIARAIDRAHEKITQQGTSRGTPAYMSPEQARDRAFDGRSDVYSLACVLYEAIAGVPPFVGDTPQQLLTQRISKSRAAAPRVSPRRAAAHRGRHRQGARHVAPTTGTTTRAPSARRSPPRSEIRARRCRPGTSGRPRGVRRGSGRRPSPSSSPAAPRPPPARAASSASSRRAWTAPQYAVLPFSTWAAVRPARRWSRWHRACIRSCGSGAGCTSRATSVCSMRCTTSATARCRDAGGGPVGARRAAGVGARPDAARLAAYPPRRVRRARRRDTARGDRGGPTRCPHRAGRGAARRRADLLREDGRQPLDPAARWARGRSPRGARTRTPGTRSTTGACRQRTAFARAVAADPGFAGPRVWLAQLDTWRDEPARVWQRHLAIAGPGWATLSPREQRIGEALRAIARGRLRDACSATARCATPIRSTPPRGWGSRTARGSTAASCPFAVVPAGRSRAASRRRSGRTIAR